MCPSKNYFAVAALASFGACAYDLTPPVVDLGYGLWQGTLNVTGQYYNFSNIRYARAPVGDLRWAPPQIPLVNRSTINDGQDGRICPQAIPSWAKERDLFLKQYLETPNNISEFTHDPAPGFNTTAVAPTASDGRTNEDCLFLEVLVPRVVYEQTTPLIKAPVLVWTFGGGFYEGSIQSQGNPAGLLARSMTGNDTAPGMIYVSINYRLGALGWLSGSTFEASGGISNVGLYDQRFALEWVQEHISKFGGDPARVTLAGESAGASMSLHQLTAYGNSTPAPFQQLFTASPAFHPSVNASLHDAIYMQFLTNANVKTFAQLRNASSATIVRANELSVFQAPYGSSNFGPIVGDDFVPAPPVTLLARGLHAQNVKALMVSHNTNEGLLFTDPSIQNTSTFNEYVQTTLFPAMSPEDFAYLTQDLYPPIFTNISAFGYNDTISRLAAIQADFLVNCNANQLLVTVALNLSHAFLFGEGAGLHGEDTPYHFYNFPGPVKDVYGIGDVNQTSAEAIQDWMVKFVSTGNPNGKRTSTDGVTMPSYGKQRSMALVTSNSLGKTVSDPTQEQRCQFWQGGRYLGRE